MIVLLAAWCGGLVAGAALLLPALAPALFLVAALGAGLAVASTALGRPRRMAAACLFAPAVLAAGLGRGALSVHVAGPGSVDWYYGRHLSLEGTVARSSGGAAFQSFWLTDLDLAGRRLVGTIQVSARSAVAVIPGSRLRVTGTLERLPGRAYDGSTGYDDRMERLGVLAAMPGAGFAPLAPAPAWSPAAMTWRVRSAVTAGIRARLPEPEATVLLGEVVGIRGKLPATTEADLVDSGLVHVLAVSGLKVAVVAGILSSLLRRAGRRPALLAIAGVFAYAAIGGGSSAAMRSAIMGSLGLTAQVLRRDTEPARSLLLAGAVMLGLAPSLVSDLSFQYSFLGVAGIQLLNPTLHRRLGFVPPPFRDALSVSVAAQAATLPLTAAYFHVVPMAGPAVNGLVVPFLGPAMLAGAWVASGLPDAGSVVLALAAGSTHALLLLAHLAASAPAGVLRLPWAGLPEALAYYVGAVTWLASRALRRRVVGRPPRVVLLGALPALLLTWMALSLPDGRLHMVFLDTPGGGALVTAPDGARLLIDSGRSAAALSAALDAHLGPAQPRLDALLLTGSGPGAAGGLAGLGPRVPALYMLPAESPGDVPAVAGQGLSRLGAAEQLLAPGMALRWHGLDLQLDACGPGLAVTLRYGGSAAWLCSSGLKGDPGTLPVSALAAMDVGDGGAEPESAQANVAQPNVAQPVADWVVQHAGRGATGGLAPAALGPRLWRTPRDGPLALTCNLQGCWRGPE